LVKVGGSGFPPTKPQYNINNLNTMKHIPTLTLTFNKQTELYGYSYDDENGNTINSDGYMNINDALGFAWKKLKTYIVMEDVEVYE